MRVTIQYFPGDSVLHRMDPATKFAWVLAVGVLAFILTAPLLIAALFATVLLVWFVLADVPFQRATRSAGWVFLLAGAGLAFQLIGRAGGETLVQLGPFAITEDGVKGGLHFSARIIFLAFSMLAFVWTTDPRDLVVALASARVPYRIAYMLFVVLRILPVLENEAMVIREAQAVRGVAEVHGRIERMKRYALPLLVAGIRRAELIAVAMDCRGFGAYRTRTFVDEFHWTRPGLVFATGTVLFAAVLLYLNAQLG